MRSRLFLLWFAGLSIDMNPYEILLVAENADDETIKRAYRIEAQRSHPDKNNGDDEKFHQVKLAYDVLKDPERRARYDETGDTSEKVQNVAESRLIMLFNTLISEGDFTGDIIKSCGDKVHHAITELNKQLSTVNIKCVKLEKQQGRVKADDFNLYEQMLSSKIDELKNNSSQVQTEIDLLNEVADMLNAYEDGAPEIVIPPSNTFLGQAALGGLGSLRGNFQP